MKPGIFALNLYRGDTGHWVFRLWTDIAKTEPADLTGVTVNAVICDKPGGTLLATLGCVVVLPNSIEVTLSAADSALLPIETACGAASSAIGMWDLQLTYPGGDVVTLLAGPVKVTPDVTRVTEASARSQAAVLLGRL